MRFRFPLSRKGSRSTGSRRAAPPTSGPKTVEEAINQFANSNLPSKWPHINKTDLLNDIRQTVADPYRVNQNRTPFCGPASITFELVRKQPIQYVRFLKQLYEIGQFKTKTGKIVKAGRKLLASKKPDEISVADWVFIGTLRDAKNLFVSVKSEGGTDFPSRIAGGTGVPAMKSWTKHVLGFRKAKYKSAIFFGDIKTLKKANSALRRGGVAFPVIHKGLIEEIYTDWGGPQIPNHWVVFLGNLQVKRRNVADSVQFDLYSWGQKFHIKTDKRTFRQYYTGVVIGEPF